MTEIHMVGRGEWDGGRDGEGKEGGEGEGRKSKKFR